MNDLTAHSRATADLIAGRSGDPFAVLGPHGETVTAFLPGAASVEIITTSRKPVTTRCVAIDPAGLFSGSIKPGTRYRLRIDWHGTVQETEDPYSFGPLLGSLDLHLLAEGRHRDLGACLGSHVMEVDGVKGVRFAVWAPNARRVSVVGNFNAWDGRRHPMRCRHEAGVWEIFIPRLTADEIYKYELLGPSWEPLPLKADPIAGFTERPPATGSMVPDPAPFAWTDAAWLARRHERQRVEAPISIYEMHAASWMHADGHSLDWRGLTDRLVPYAAEMGFTHIEMMPIMAHPFGGSWGYQPLGLFAPMAELGRPADFARFVDHCHAAGIGVLVDWVPAHFPNDAHGLAHFDGTSLYEHADPREGMHIDWNTLIYNVGRNEVRGFLIASALHWIEHFHVDGVRVDAVASMLYRDYSRKAGEWIPNIYGGRENLEAVAFFRELNVVIAERNPGVMVIAEESTAWPGVTAPVSDWAPHDLGFNFKWNMGWMHDTLAYMEQNPIYRRYHHHEMTFGIVYAYSEKFVLPLSHDEVVYGKGSLLGKMPGDDWQQFANLRAYFTFMWTHPGKKLLFMGGEFAQRREWNHDASLDWHLLDAPAHRGVQLLVRDLNRLYVALPALHSADCRPEGFRWIVIDDSDQSVIAYLRLAHDGTDPYATAIVICNFTPVPRYDYRIGAPLAGQWRETLNSDAADYGGSGIGNGGLVHASDSPSHGLPASMALTLPPLASLILVPDGHR